MDWDSLWNIIKDIILYGYYIAGIVLAVGVIIAGRQLKLMKKDNADKNKRAAIQKSIDYLDWFATKFIPEQGEFLKKLRGKNIMIYSELKEMPFVFNDEVNLDNEKVLENIILKHNAGAIHLINKLEFFSAAIISGLADEELTFNPVCNLFCEFVEFNYDVYCHSRKNSTKKFTNTIQLYELWKGKIHNKDIEEQVEMLQNSKKEIKVPTIIGQD